ncbi:MAG: type VI secretion system tip protein VgrG [Verrucomicrobiales bacterium]|nr:type VI secretion system tip protein VgrG [Verrucomicrobiales bacterium]
MPEFNQTNRLAAIQTPLGKDKLGLLAFSGREEVSQLFEYEVDMICHDQDVDLNKLIGGPASIRMNTKKGKVRHLHGRISRVRQVGAYGKYGRYKATIVPWLWLLTRRADCRIYQKRTIPQIIEDVFKRAQLGDYEFRLSANYAEWEYCVQYRETDYNFVCRLMEQEGIYYYFLHSEDTHRVIIADSPGAHEDCPDHEQLPYHPGSGQSRDFEAVLDWATVRELQSGSYEHTDYDPKAPTKDLKTNYAIRRNHTASDMAVFDYPGEFDQVAEGRSYAKVRLQEIQSKFELADGETDGKGLHSGGCFTLSKHPREDQCKRFLILRTLLNVRVGEFESELSNEQEPPFFHCAFRVMDAAENFRPPRLTPKPVVQGPQTARVVGPDGEEIHVDEFGRIKVHFHWDRHNPGDDRSSCWLRLGQMAAGKGFGSVWIPRVGHEVIVDFLEGDPDQPIVTGSLYNKDNTLPYTLPGEKTKSTVKTNSSKGGEGFNELRFEDKKGSEQVFLHAEKDLDLRVKHDTIEYVGNSRHLIVKRDQIEHVENNREEKVDADHKEQIGKDRNLKVTGKEAVEIGGSCSITVKGDVVEVFKSSHNEKTSQDYYLTASNIVIEATSNITLKVGGSSIAIDATGIGLKTSGMIKIESTGPMEAKSSATLKLDGAISADLHGATTNVKGDAMVVVQAALVKIN